MTAHTDSRRRPRARIDGRLRRASVGSSLSSSGSAGLLVSCGSLASAIADNLAASAFPPLAAFIGVSAGLFRPVASCRCVLASNSACCAGSASGLPVAFLPRLAFQAANICPAIRLCSVASLAFAPSWKARTRSSALPLPASSQLLAMASIDGPSGVSGCSGPLPSGQIPRRSRAGVASRPSRSGAGGSGRARRRRGTFGRGRASCGRSAR